MAANILALIQFDDNTPVDQPPFSYEPNTWSLEHDIGLWGCKDYRFIAAISGVRSDGKAKPLISLRGVPDTDLPRINELKGEPNVGWLTYTEILACIQHSGMTIGDLHQSVVNVLSAMTLLREKYGDERVRLVFAICD